MLRTFFSLAFAALTTSLLAQGYDPYAVVKEEPPIRADGTLNWPSFYKNAETEKRFQGYFATGSCVGTNMRIVNMLKENTVVVNALPTAKVTTQAGLVENGAIKAVDAQGNAVTLVMHPKGVSKLEISGEMLADLVAPGMLVRFRGTIDDKGQGKGPIEQIAVLSPSKEQRLLEVFPGKEQTIFGQVERRDHNRVKINVARGKYKVVTFTLPSDAKVTVTGTTPNLIFAGDLVEAEGKAYIGSGTGTQQTLFAEKLIVKKSLPGSAPAEPAPAPAQVAE